MMWPRIFAKCSAFFNRDEFQSLAQYRILRSESVQIVTMINMLIARDIRRQSVKTVGDCKVLLPEDPFDQCRQSLGDMTRLIKFGFNLFQSFPDVPLLHFQPQKTSFWTTGGFRLVTVILIEGCTANIQSFHCTSTLGFIIGILSQAV